MYLYYIGKVIRFKVDPKDLNFALIQYKYCLYNIYKVIDNMFFLSMNIVVI